MLSMKVKYVKYEIWGPGGRAGGRTPRTPPAGGPRVCQGPHVTLSMKFFLDFLMFSKYL